MSSGSLPAELIRRHRQLFSFCDRGGTVDHEEFLASHSGVFAAFKADPQAARGVMARSAGGFFDVLDLDGVGRMTGSP
jgi:hypothetical protein